MKNDNAINFNVGWALAHHFDDIYTRLFSDINTDLQGEERQRYFEK